MELSYLVPSMSKTQARGLIIIHRRDVAMDCDVASFCHEVPSYMLEISGVRTNTTRDALSRAALWQYTLRVLVSFLFII